MFFLELDHLDGNHYRISWNGSATYNLQIPVGGQWVDIECFTCYEYDNPNDAFNFAMDWMIENIDSVDGHSQDIKDVYTV